MLLNVLLSGGISASFRVFSRGFCFGLCSKIILSLTSLTSFRRLLFTSGGKSNLLRSGLLFGLLGGMFKLLAVVGIHSFGKSQASPVVFLSAVCASQAMRLETSPSKRSIYATYTFVRACWSLLHDKIQIQRTHDAGNRLEPKNTSSQCQHLLLHHGAPLLFILSCTQIMWCWFYYPTYIEGIYKIWITRMAHMDEDLVKALRDLHHGRVHYGTRSEVLRKYSLRHGLDPEKANLLSFVPMHYVHPIDQNFTSKWLVRRFVVGMMDAVPLYTPVHLIPLLCFRFRALMRDPWGGLTRVVTNIVQSSSFLASFITLAWAPILLLRKTLRKDTSIGIGMGCLACGMSIYAERSSRRRELAMFVFPRVLEIWYEYLVRKKWIRPVSNGSVWIFSLSIGLIAERSMRGIEQEEDIVVEVKTAGTTGKVKVERHGGSGGGGNLFLGMAAMILK
jgi:hypothetical protein